LTSMESHMCRRRLPADCARNQRACLVGHVCLWGNAYAEIERSDAGIKRRFPGHHIIILDRGLELGVLSAPETPE